MQDLDLSAIFANISAPNTLQYTGIASAGPHLFGGCYPTETAYATAFVAGEPFFAKPNIFLFKSPTSLLTINWQYPGLTLASVAGSAITLVGIMIHCADV